METENDTVLFAVREAVREERLAPDLEHIAQLVEPGARVLDLGCGSGELLKWLQKTKQCYPQGVEISEECIRRCIEKGLPVYHGDLDEGLADFEDQAIDYVILTNVIQVLHKPDFLVREAARVGKKVIVSFPNFANWRARVQLALTGRMPRTKQLPYEWYNSPNIHLTTIKDFRDLARGEGLEVTRSVFLKHTADGSYRAVSFWPNLFAEQAIFLLERG